MTPDEQFWVSHSIILCFLLLIYYLLLPYTFYCILTYSFQLQVECLWKGRHAYWLSSWCMFTSMCLLIFHWERRFLFNMVSCFWHQKSLNYLCLLRIHKNFWIRNSAFSLLKWSCKFWNFPIGVKMHLQKKSFSMQDYLTYIIVLPFAKAFQCSLKWCRVFYIENDINFACLHVIGIKDTIKSYWIVVA